jgi:hypothetical protein
VFLALFLGEYRVDLLPGAERRVIAIFRVVLLVQ